MKAFVVAFALVAAAGTAAAESNQTQEGREATAQRTDGAESEQDEKSDRVICRRIRGGMATGSQLTQRRCLTAAQWQRLRDR